MTTFKKSISLILAIILMVNIIPHTFVYAISEETFEIENAEDNNDEYIQDDVLETDIQDELAENNDAKEEDFYNVEYNITYSSQPHSINDLNALIRSIIYNGEPYPIWEFEVQNDIIPLAWECIKVDDYYTLKFNFDFTPQPNNISDFEFDNKPKWEYPVPDSLLPSNYKCEELYDEELGVRYYSWFLKPTIFSATEDIDFSNVEDGIGYTMDDYTLTITDDGEYLIYDDGTLRYKNIIIDANATVTIQNINIETMGIAPFQVTNDKIATLILSGNNILLQTDEWDRDSAHSGIEILQNAVLTITGTKDDTLTVGGGAAAAAIGVPQNTKGGSVIINGGKINIQNTEGSATGIGAGWGYMGESSMKDIIITGSTIIEQITNGDQSAAIGSGFVQMGTSKVENITISGNAVIKDVFSTIGAGNAMAGPSSVENILITDNAVIENIKPLWSNAGIGSGRGEMVNGISSVGDITITGNAKINTIIAHHAAGIGSGSTYNNGTSTVGDIVISGNVTIDSCEADYMSAAIGTGFAMGGDSKVGNILITDEVHIKSLKNITNSAVIGSSSADDNISSVENITISGNAKIDLISGGGKAALIGSGFAGGFDDTTKVQVKDITITDNVIIGLMEGSETNPTVGIGSGFGVAGVSTVENITISGNAKINKIDKVYAGIGTGNTNRINSISSIKDINIKDNIIIGLIDASYHVGGIGIGSGSSEAGGLSTVENIKIDGGEITVVVGTESNAIGRSYYTSSAEINGISISKDAKILAYASNYPAILNTLSNNAINPAAIISLTYNNPQFEIFDNISLRTNKNNAGTLNLPNNKDDFVLTFDDSIYYNNVAFTTTASGKYYLQGNQGSNKTVIYDDDLDYADAYVLSSDSFNVRNLSVVPDGLQITVDFNVDGGTLVNPIIQNYSTTIDTAPLTTKNGFGFAGWHEEPALINKVNFPIELTQDITLYAKWIMGVGNVSFNTNGGTIVNTISDDYGNYINTSPTTEKTGHIFKGWYKDENFINEAIFPYMIIEDIILYAKWEMAESINNSFKVVFNSNGGTLINFQTILDGEKVLKPSDPVKLHHKFLGWHYNNQLWDFNNAINSDIELVAKWQSIKKNSENNNFISSDRNTEEKIIIYNSDSEESTEKEKSNPYAGG